MAASVATGPTHDRLTIAEPPVVVIKASSAWAGEGLKELWQYRELLYFLAWRDVKVRYKQTLFGVVWVVMQPLLMTLIFTVFLGILARVPAGGKPYPLVVYTGLLPWTFFSSAVVGCIHSLVGNSNLITKVYFPRVLIPAASILARLLDLAISFGLLAGLMLYYRLVVHYPLTLTRNVLMLPFIVLLVVLFSLGLGMLVSSLNVKYRDIGVAIPVLIQLWMFTSPVVYSLDVVPEKWRPVYFLNPLAGMIDAFRTTMLGGEMNKFALLVSTIATTGLLVIATYIFRRTQRSFADVI
jgi:lipopolysaccharide transport system permease protein